MTPNDIITWLRDKLPYAPDHAWKNVMSAAADKLEELEERRRFAAVQALLLADDKEQLEERVAKLEEELKAQFVKDTNVLTNADRIRAMSDEELADWLARTQIANVAEALAIARVPWKQEDGMKDEVKKGCLEWLRQPAEEVKGDA